MTIAERNRAIKKVLVKKYGKVSLIGGKGTAFGWITIKVTLPVPKGHIHDEINYGHCRACNEAGRLESKEISKVCHQVANEIGSHISTYCSDDGYGSDNDEILIDVNYI